MSKTIAIAVLLAVIAAGIAAGVARDLYSSKRGETSGDVIAVSAGGQDYKSFAWATPALTVRLDDGSEVRVAVKQPHTIKPGDRVALIEMATPWGQVWYQLNNP